MKSPSTNDQGSARDDDRQPTAPGQPSSDNDSLTSRLPRTIGHDFDHRHDHSAHDEATSWLARAKRSPLWRLETALISGAVVLGLGSAALSEANRDAQNRDLVSRFKVTQIAVAAKDLPAGSRLEAESVRFAESLEARTTANAVDPEHLKAILGRPLAIDLKAGDPILLTGVEGATSGSAAANKIPPGKRLVTLAIRDKVAQKGWIKPNDRVDVITTMDLPGRGRTTFTLMEDITLVSVGKASVWAQGQNSEGTEIGFYASPRDVEFIGFAEKSGEFSLSLRNPEDLAKSGDGAHDLGRDGMDMNKFLDHAAINKASGGGELPVYVQGQKDDGKQKKK